MLLSIQSVHATCDIHTEKILLEVHEDVNLINYELVNQEQTFFYFPERVVKRGDRIHIISRHGKEIVIENDDGSRTHVFFCNKNECIWNVGQPIIRTSKIRNHPFVSRLELP